MLEGVIFFLTLHVVPKFKPQYRRLLFLHKKLQEKTYPNCRSLAEEWEVSAKTFQRDIDYLKYELNAPIEYDAQKHGYYYSEPNFSLPAMNISESDLFAICIAENALRAFKNTPLYKTLSTVFAKIQDSLPEKTSVQPSWFNDRILICPEPTTVIKPKNWETIAKALRDNRQLRITHLSPDRRKKTERTVNPYYLVNFKGEWYLSSYCHEREAIRTFAVSRIPGLQLLKDTFELPREMSRDTMFGDQMGIIWKKDFHKVRIRFSPVIAPYIREREWHPKQEIKDLKSGALDLSFTTNHLMEVKDWVLSWGPQAKVMEPKKLKDKIKADLQATLKQY